MICLSLHYSIRDFFPSDTPLLHTFFRYTGRKSFTFLPVSGPCHFCKIFSAVTKAGRCRSTEWDHCFSCEIIFFYKFIYRPGRFAPPDRKLKCSQFPSCVDFTGFNCIQNCVYCYYLSFFSKIALKHRPHYFHI